MRAELRRRLEACKELATLACHNPLATTAEPTRQIENSTQKEGGSATQARKPFHVSFTKLANAEGAAIISNLRWVIPSSKVSVIRIRETIPFKIN